MAPRDGDAGREPGGSGPHEPSEEAVGASVPGEAPGTLAGRRPDAVVLRERFTNRLARYLRGDPGLRAELREAIRRDVAVLLEARNAGPVADAVLALTSAHLPRPGAVETGIAGAGEAGAGSGFRGGVRTVDPLLPVLLAPEVLAELEARGVTPLGAPLRGAVTSVSPPTGPARRSR
jgi:hypothetical protein